MILRLGYEQVRVLTQHSWSPVSFADVQTSPVAARKTGFLWAGPCLAAVKEGMSQVLRIIIRKDVKRLKAVRSVCKK